MARPTLPVIRTRAQLPDWFKKRKYRKRISATDWYREIRRREYAYWIWSRISEDERYGASEKSGPESSWIKALFLIEPDPNALIYEIVQYNRPVEDLTVLESFYLSAIVRDPALGALREQLNNLLAMWDTERAREQGRIWDPGYEQALATFVTDLDAHPAVHEPNRIELGNPFLSYGRPLNGYPLTIDTQFDDQTIFSAVKRWLKQKRQEADASIIATSAAS